MPSNCECYSGYVFYLCNIFYILVNIFVKRTAKICRAVPQRKKSIAGFMDNFNADNTDIGNLDALYEFLCMR